MSASEAALTIPTICEGFQSSTRKLTELQKLESFKPTTGPVVKLMTEHVKQRRDASSRDDWCWCNQQELVIKGKTEILTGANITKKAVLMATPTQWCHSKVFSICNKRWNHTRNCDFIQTFNQQTLVKQQIHVCSVWFESTTVYLDAPVTN